MEFFSLAAKRLPASYYLQQMLQIWTRVLFFAQDESVHLFS